MTCLGSQGQRVAAPDFKPQKLTSRAHICTQETSPSQAERDFKGHLTGLQPS